MFSLDASGAFSIIWEASANPSCPAPLLSALMAGCWPSSTLASLVRTSEYHLISSYWAQIPSAHEGGAALTVDGCASGAFATCGQKTDMRVFTSAGREAANLNTAGLTNHGVALSANGQFLAAATFTADVKVRSCLVTAGTVLLRSGQLGASCCTSQYHLVSRTFGGVGFCFPGLTQTTTSCR